MIISVKFLFFTYSHCMAPIALPLLFTLKLILMLQNLSSSFFCLFIKGVTYKVVVKTGAKKNGGTDAKVL